MAIKVGTRLGPYEILSALGAGGMGEVYKANDTRLGRTVAIKVLPAHLSDDPKLRERFEREARTVSKLNHPRICTLHDIGRHEGIDFLVMEHLEGEPLAERLKKGALPLEQALRYGTEIAVALDEAHRAGVVHRDLKPGNIMLTRQGTKLLDFGLARLVRPADDGPADHGATATIAENPLTEEGTIVGTVAYMAPEQLEGGEADSRADIFALGGVLYEMITGRRVFDGPSRAALISAIMTAEPQPLSEIRSAVPPLLDRVVGKCLAKDPDARWQSARDLATELEWAATTDSSAPGPTGSSRKTLAAVAWGLAGIAVGVLATAALLLSDTPEPVPSTLTRFTLDVPSDHELLMDVAPIGSPASSPAAISPDGQKLVYAAKVVGGRSMLFMRELGRLGVTALPATEGGRDPFFSPDGKWVGFRTDDALKKVPLGGGASLTIANAKAEGRGGSWGSDDWIVYETGNSILMRVHAGGGEAEPLTQPVGLPHRGPQVLPNGDVLFSGWFRGWALALVSSETAEARIIEIPGQVLWGQYVPTGHLVYLTPDGLMAASFDLKTLRFTGQPVAVSRDANTFLTFSDTGTVAYAASASPGFVLVWVDREGRAEPLPIGNFVYHIPRVSPDGSRVAFDAIFAGNIWVHELARGTSMRLTVEGPVAQTTWSADGARITFSGADGNIQWAPSDGSGAAETLLERENELWPTSWSPDGRHLAYTEVHPESDRDIWILPADGEPIPFVVTSADEGAATFSPDGRWIAYRSKESGQNEIYVRPFPGPGGKWLVSTNGGRWSADGSELFYRQGNTMMSVATKLGDDFQASKPVSLFSGEFETDPMGHPIYDVRSADQFLMVRRRDEQSRPQITVALNWFDELRRLAPPD